MNALSRTSKLLAVAEGSSDELMTLIRKVEDMQMLGMQAQLALAKISEPCSGMRPH
jgi:hypothetical protein